MERIKQFVFKNFERILVSIIIVVAFIGGYFIEPKSIVLNFYYLPVLSAGYFLGRRMGILTAIFSILIVVVSTLIFPETYFKEPRLFITIAYFISWGGFLLLASVVVGTLYERNEHRIQELKFAYIGILEILAKYLESADRYTRGHSVRVSELAMEIAIAMELPRGEVENIRVGGLLHDIGKIEVSSEILLKASSLSLEEKKLMDEHTVKGGALLSSVGAVLQEVVPIVVSHHKYFTSVLEETQEESPDIPLGARVIAIADAFDAMVTDRPYRKGMLPREATEEIIRKTGKQFDPQAVDAFKYVMKEKMMQA